MIRENIDKKSRFSTNVANLSQEEPKDLLSEKSIMK